ncbi:hypothetical protein L9F63_017516, partial [Diploptera punctata]
NLKAYMRNQPPSSSGRPSKSFEECCEMTCHANTLISAMKPHPLFSSARGTHLHLRPANKTLNSLADYQIPLLRVYRKHDRSLQSPTSWIKQQGCKVHRLPSGCSRFVLCKITSQIRPSEQIKDETDLLVDMTVQITDVNFELIHPFSCHIRDTE